MNIRIVSAKHKLTHLLGAKQSIDELINFIERHKHDMPNLGWCSTLSLFFDSTLTNLDGYEILSNDLLNYAFFTFKIIDGYIVGCKLYYSSFASEDWILNLDIPAEWKQKIINSWKVLL